ncbi:hypothetical protein PGTUg99_034633 [Puccinia graminis f. sp. tritici]|uniref:Uncharacterized protein n=1 Tax=Puccinia graminis f. sp. tritici TaxID=56615 RepID=A0A5B0RN98_PUCGR|nr:hypothetical protein PGTUg99_034633 [Puccinia graminis f. sp. tritici]
MRLHPELPYCHRALGQKGPVPESIETTIQILLRVMDSSPLILLCIGLLSGSTMMMWVVHYKFVSSAILRVHHFYRRQFDPMIATRERLACLASKPLVCFQRVSQDARSLAKKSWKRRVK